jgi:ERF superfamily
MTDQKGSLAGALAKLQTKLPEIRRSETAVVETTEGRYSYTYADLAQITRALLPLMGELGLSFLARPAFVGDRFALVCSLLHTSGEREDAQYPLPTSGTPQAIGSAITYGRRYTLCAMTGVATEDDDDAAAAQAEVAAGGRTAQRAARQPPPTSGHDPVKTAQRAARTQQPGPPLPGEDNPNMRTAAQLGTMLKLFGRCGIDDRTIRLAVCGQIVGRQLATANDMTKRDASKVIDLLMKVVDDPVPLSRLADDLGLSVADLTPDDREAGDE